MNQLSVIQALQKRYGTSNFCNWQVLRWSYYDYIRYASTGTNALTFFNNPTGSVDPNSGLAKTMEETNVPKSRTFGQVYFFVHQIRTHVMVLPKGRQPAGIQSQASAVFNGYTPLMQQIYNLCGQGVLNVTLGQKEYYDIPKPFVYCPPGIGVKIQSHANTTGTGSLWTQQSTSPHDVYHVTPVQLIEPEQTMEWTINFPQANSPSIANTVGGVTPYVNIGLILDGYLARPMQ